MRLSTRISLGFFLIAGLLIGTLAYQLSVVERLQRINQEISLTNLEAARISVWLLEGLEGVREFALKFSVLGDPDYMQHWEEWEDVMRADLQSLDMIGLTGPEEEGRARIQDAWSAYVDVAERVRGDPTALIEVERALAALRSRIEELIVANEASVSAHAQASIAAGSEARRVSWISAAVALVLAGLAGLLLHRAISGPLRGLTRGTREVARGRFDHRLQVRGPGELAELAEDFNRMAARLDELEELKRDFVSHVSHELKTPLAAIQETIEIFAEEIPGPLNEKQMRLMRLSRSSAQRLSAMISDLLDTSRLEAGATTYHPDVNDLAEIATEVLTEIEPLADDRELRLLLRVEDAAASATLVCDGPRMRDVVMNVVTNALRFSPRRGTVDVSLTELPALPAELPHHLAESIRTEQPPYLLLSVADEGPGVADGEKERIFEKFHQAGRKERVRGQGVGLGLAIAQRLVQGHGGAIWVEDRPGGGALFRILVPRTPRRWQEISLNGSAPDRSPEVDGGFRRATGRVARTASLVVVLTATAGCATLRTPPPPEPVPEPVVTLPAPAVEPQPLPPPGDVPGTAALAEARALLLEEQFEQAGAGFRGLLNEWVSPEITREALWGLALVHLHPRNPLADRGEALPYLDVLAEDFPDTLPGIQAQWARGMLVELVDRERRIQEQDELLRELSEVLEALRGIDLQRQPSRTPVRPDATP